RGSERIGPAKPCTRVAAGRFGIVRIRRDLPGGAGDLLANLARQVAQPHDAAFADCERRANDVAELAYVAGPRIAQQALKGVHFDRGWTSIARCRSEEVVNEALLIGALRERR